MKDFEMMSSKHLIFNIHENQIMDAGQMNDLGSRCLNIENLILLIGHNPMPNYLVTRLLRPKCVHCLYTNETKDELIQIKGVLRAQMSDLEFQDYYLHDATNPLEIRKSMKGIPPGAHLNYTGGTKAMTVNAYDYWMEFLEGDHSRASYFDGYQGILHFNDGSSLSAAGIELTIDQVLQLHGLDRDPELVYHPEANILSDGEDARKIADAVLQDPGLASKLYDAFSVYQKGSNRESILPPKATPAFMKSPVWLDTDRGERKTRKKILKSWERFLTGGWFEDFVENAVRKAYPEGTQVAAGLRPKNKHQTELDLLVLVGYRVYLISVTTATNARTVKGKCFEARNRVELVGGDLAQAAVACLLTPDLASEVEEKVRVPWQPAESAVKVFNIEHIRAWNKGDYSTLLEWLTKS